MSTEHQFVQAFRLELRETQKQHPLFEGIHPFWRDCFGGRLGREAIRQWALEIYPLVRDFSRLYIQVAGKCDSERTLTFLSETIYEETGSGNELESHPTLFRNFIKSLDVPETRIPDRPRTNAGRQLLDFCWATVRDEPFVIGLALLGLAIERPLPTFFSMVARAFKQHLDLNDADLRYFLVHTVADVKHSQLAARVVAEEACTAERRRSVKSVLNRVWDLQLQQLNELHLDAHGREPSVRPQ